ncbi:HD-GYP domain-containing protein [Sphingobium sp.]|uniref:HD-GYP domain-containing protein n=1 Tax=Sphingobium sp. TaxID=1912891 RepID=UPI0025E3ACED|nr:HD-GYP domain-containing protein [Sphingobium sp.]
MYISGFEGSWFRHPFWRAGFLIEDEATLEKIRSSDVRAVIIDTRRGIAAPAEAPAAAQPQAPSEPDSRILDFPAARPGQTADAELERARSILHEGKALVTGLFNDARLGKLTVTQDVVALVSDIALSVERNHATLINMARLKSRDEYTYLHSMAVCALMINFARHLQMPEAQVHEMGVAGLLHDVGKMAMPPEILNKAGRLTSQEFAEMQRHPLAGRELLATCDNVPPAALDVALHHHERVDGAGYPFGLMGPDISIAARMGAICDIYDALTSDRCYKDAWTPTEAITRMASWQGHCDPGLLFTFMQSLAIFPPGLLVRLRSNRLAVVLPNGRRGSRAMARAFFDARARDFLPAQDVSITGDLNGDRVIGREEPAHWPFPDWVRLHADLMDGKYNLQAVMQRHAG